MHHARCNLATDKNKMPERGTIISVRSSKSWLEKNKICSERYRELKRVLRPVFAWQLLLRTRWAIWKGYWRRWHNLAFAAAMNNKRSKDILSFNIILNDLSINNSGVYFSILNQDLVASSTCYLATVGLHNTKFNFKEHNFYLKKKNDQNRLAILTYWVNRQFVAHIIYARIIIWFPHGCHC